MQDNATTHISEATMDFVQKKYDIDVQGWAACSTDCIPIEHLLAIMLQQILEGGKIYGKV